MPDAPRGLVISFPRSGMNWLRHCCEHFSGIRTPGRRQLIADGPALFDRAHDVRRTTLRSDYSALYDRAGNENYARVALLLRDPCECFISHYLVRADASFANGPHQFAAFSNNIAAFDSLRTAEKGVFYFDEFINRKDITSRFLQFFGVEANFFDQDWERLKRNSLAWYRQQHGTVENEKRPQLRPNQRRMIWQRLRCELGDALFEKYLGRFDHGALDSDEGDTIASSRLGQWVKRQFASATVGR